MDIIRHDNPYKPDQEIYKCTIRYTTQYGTLEEVTAWRDDQIKNEAYYKECEELSFKAAGEFYKTLNYKGD
jgi:predicted N-formylglutamate amidohydrolase